MRLEEDARKRADEEATARPPANDKSSPTTRRTPKEKDDGGLVRDVVRSSAFKDFMRTAAREIARGMFKTGRR